VPVEMWKSHLINYNNYTYISTGLVDKMWINYFPVENLDENVGLSNFHRVETSLSCGNVENFI